MKPWWGALAFAMVSTPMFAQQFNTPLTPSVAVTPLGSLSFTPAKIFNPVDFGAKCDGGTDDTSALQAWLNQAAPGVELRGPAGTCLFSDLLFQPYANRYTLRGAGPGATTLKYIGPDYNGSTAASASWTSGVTSITISGSPPIVATALSKGFKVTAWDTITGQMIGRVTAISSTLMIVPDGAANASVGASDAIHLTTDLLTVSDTGHGGEIGAYFADFNIVSATTLTGGYAIHAHGLFDSQFTNVWTDTSNSADATTHGKLCGGFWVDGSGGTSLFRPEAFSLQNCGDGILTNSALGGAAEVYVVGGNIGGVVSSGVVSGFTSGLHMAGGFGGMRCDGTNVHNNLIGGLVDNAVYAGPNREFDIGSTCAIDASQNYGVLVNDTLSGGGTIDIAGWIASTQTGPGVRIQSWINGDVEMRGHKLYNDCGPGIWIDDSTSRVTLASTLVINNNWNTGLGSACTTWQTANPGLGYGIYASANSYNILSFAQVWGSPGGANINSHAMVPTMGGYGLAFTAGGNAGMMLNHGAGSYVSSLYFANNGASKWQWGIDNNDALTIWDVVNGSTWLLHCLTGGICTIGESAASSVLTVKGLAQLTGYLIASLPTCNSGAQGSLAYVTNGVASPVWLGTVSATGSSHQLVECNGSTWTYR